MMPEPYGPELVVGQLQLEFAGVAPLTLDQRLEEWLSHQDEPTSDVLTAALFIADNDSRRRRAVRYKELLELQAPYAMNESWLVSGGVEVIWLYEEGCRGYINGAFLSALLCSHAACERVLAGCLFSCREELDKRWLMWGLGNLMTAAAERGMINDELRGDLAKLNEIRKVSAHFKPSHETTTSVGYRALSELTEDSGAAHEAAINSIVRTDALFALQVATFMVRSDLSMTAIKL